MGTDKYPAVIIYTCITGSYDELWAPTVVDPGVIYLCFTDFKMTAVPPWQIIDISYLKLDAKDRNRYVKMYPHRFLPKHDISLYVDGSVKIVGNVRELALTATGQREDIFLYDHPQRNCVYDEAAACAHFAHDWIWRISIQMRRYRRLGYPFNHGLFEAGVIIRRDSEQVRRMMDAWWSEYLIGAKRDQLSLPFVAWTLGVALGSLGSSDPRTSQRYLKLVNHPRRIRLKSILIKYVNRAIARIIPRRALFGKAPVSEVR